MSEFRKFRLLNKEGQAYDLTSKTQFFHDPKGLGFERSTSVRRIGNRFVLVSSQPKQGAPQGTLSFAGIDPYGDYYKFVEFCQSSELVLEYTIPWREDSGDGAVITTDHTFYRDVTVSKVEKAELDQFGVLNCDITFAALGQFYTKVQVSIDGGSGEHIGGSWKWPITWNPTFGGIDLNRTLGVLSDSSQLSPCKLIIYGPADYPMWQHSVDGKVFAQVRFNGIVPDGQALVVDCLNYPFSIKLGHLVPDGSEEALVDVEDVYSLVDNMTENGYQSADYSTLIGENGDLYQGRFVMLRKGENKIWIADYSGEIIPIKMEVKLYRESV